jgi:hypothetical protein
MSLDAWLIRGLVPLALVVIYRAWIEPRHVKTRALKGRLNDALDGAIDRDYKRDPSISDYGLMFEVTFADGTEATATVAPDCHTRHRMVRRPVAGAVAWCVGNSRARFVPNASVYGQDSATVAALIGQALVTSW